MKLFVIPNSITCEDGSDSIDIPVVTPEYIERQIMNIEAVGKLNIEEKDIANAVCYSRGQKQTCHKVQYIRQFD